MVEVGGDRRSPPRQKPTGGGGGGKGKANIDAVRGGAKIPHGGGGCLGGGAVEDRGGCNELRKNVEEGGTESVEHNGGSMELDGGALEDRGGLKDFGGGSLEDGGGYKEQLGGAKVHQGGNDEDLHVLQDQDVATSTDDARRNKGISSGVDPDSSMMDSDKNVSPPKGVCENSTTPKPWMRGSTNAWQKPSHTKVDWRNTNMPKLSQRVLVLNTEAINDNQRKLERAIVGKLIGKKLPFSVLLKDLLKKWSHVGEFVLIMLADDCFTCIFSTSEARDEILMGGPWHVAGYILGLNKWSLDFSPDSLEGLTAPVWIRLPKLPLLYWDNDNLARIAEMVGTPLWIDAFTSKWGRSAFARVCVSIDLSVPLPKGIWIPGVQGKFFQPIEYEGISQLCFACGVVGHKETQCPSITTKKNQSVGASSTHNSSLPKSSIKSTPPLKPTIEKGECSYQVAHTTSPPTTSSVFCNNNQLSNSVDTTTGNWTLVTRKKWKAKTIPPQQKPTHFANQPTPKSLPTTKPQYMPKPKPHFKPSTTSTSTPHPFHPSQAPFKFGTFSGGAKTGDMRPAKSAKDLDIIQFTAVGVPSTNKPKAKSKHHPVSKPHLQNDLPTLDLHAHKPRKRKKNGAETEEDLLIKEKEAMETISLITNKCGGDASPMVNQ